MRARKTAFLLILAFFTSDSLHAMAYRIMADEKNGNVALIISEVHSADFSEHISRIIHIFNQMNPSVPVPCFLEAKDVKTPSRTVSKTLKQLVAYGQQMTDRDSAPVNFVPIDRRPNEFIPVMSGFAIVDIFLAEVRKGTLSAEIAVQYLKNEAKREDFKHKVTVEQFFRVLTQNSSTLDTLIQKNRGASSEMGPAIGARLAGLRADLSESCQLLEQPLRTAGEEYLPNALLKLFCSFRSYEELSQQYKTIFKMVVTDVLNTFFIADILDAWAEQQSHGSRVSIFVLGANHGNELAAHFTHLKFRILGEDSMISGDNALTFIDHSVGPRICAGISTSVKSLFLLVDCDFCSHCFKKVPHFKICSQCKLFKYCSPECQKSDWQEHKLVCKALAGLSTSNQ
jgi:hypothetical protein